MWYEIAHTSKEMMANISEEVVMYRVCVLGEAYVCLYVWQGVSMVVIVFVGMCACGWVWAGGVGRVGVCMDVYVNKVC